MATIALDEKLFVRPDVREAVQALESVLNARKKNEDVRAVLMADILPRRLGLSCPMLPEAYGMDVVGDMLTVVGFDETGLGYGIRALAEYLEARPESELKSAAGMHASPYIKIRSTDRFIMNHTDEIWWKDPSYWKAYISMLAASRLNRLHLIVGFDTAYMAPPYPFFVDVPGYDVPAPLGCDRKENLEALRMIGRTCHEYGLTFTFAIWQQQPWQTGQSKLVSGVEDQDVLEAYCADGVKALLTACPEIDVLQYRVNHESGVGQFELGGADDTAVWDRAEQYWLTQIRAVAQVNREIRPVVLEMRAKGLTDRMMDYARSLGLKIVVSTKYTCEEMSLPHHPSQMRGQELKELDNLNMSRRYSYSDLIKKSRKHQFIYRLWMNGSNDIFTFGSVDYFSRFAKSIRVGDAEGFTIMPPLTLKGGHEFECEPEWWDLFDDPRYRWPGIEDGRYYMVYRLLGYLGYDPEAGDAVRQVPLARKYGKNAKVLGELMESMSRVLPFITETHFVEHPQLQNWLEMNTGAALFAENNYCRYFLRPGDTYGNTPALDEALVSSVEEFVQGKGGKRYSPFQVQSELARIADETAELIAKSDNLGYEDPEYLGLILDAKMLCAMARFHAEKQAAAIAVAYADAGDDRYLPSGAAHMEKAAAAWKEIVALGAPYHKNLCTGAGAHNPRHGTWADWLDEVEKDLAKIKAMAGDAKGPEVLRAALPIIAPETVATDLPGVHDGKLDLPVSVRGVSGNVTLHYRRTNHLDGTYTEIQMAKQGDAYTAVIPASAFDPDYDLLVYITCVNDEGDTLIFPGDWNRTEPMPYKLVRVEYSHL